MRSRQLAIEKVRSGSQFIFGDRGTARAAACCLCSWVSDAFKETTKEVRDFTFAFGVSESQVICHTPASSHPLMTFPASRKGAIQHSACPPPSVAGHKDGKEEGFGRVRCLMRLWVPESLVSLANLIILLMSWFISLPGNERCKGPAAVMRRCSLAARLCTLGCI